MGCLYDHLNDLLVECLADHIRKITVAMMNLRRCKAVASINLILSTEGQINLTYSLCKDGVKVMQGWYLDAGLCKVGTMVSLHLLLNCFCTVIIVGYKFNLCIVYAM